MIRKSLHVPGAEAGGFNNRGPGLTPYAAKRTPTFVRRGPEHRPFFDGFLPQREWSEPRSLTGRRRSPPVLPREPLKAIYNNLLGLVGYGLGAIRDETIGEPHREHRFRSSMTSKPYLQRRRREDLFIASVHFFSHLYVGRVGRQLYDLYTDLIETDPNEPRIPLLRDLLETEVAWLLLRIVQEQLQTILDTDPGRVQSFFTSGQGAWDNVVQRIGQAASWIDMGMKYDAIPIARIPKKGVISRLVDHIPQQLLGTVPSEYRREMPAIQSWPGVHAMVQLIETPRQKKSWLIPMMPRDLRHVGAFYTLNSDSWIDGVTPLPAAETLTLLLITHSLRLAQFDRWDEVSQEAFDRHFVQVIAAVQVYWATESSPWSIHHLMQTVGGMAVLVKKRRKLALTLIDSALNPDGELIRVTWESMALEVRRYTQWKDAETLSLRHLSTHS